jgi:hypothetical protein
VNKERDWKMIKYYPVSIEKLMKASMREAAYLIAPVNIGEDYEYFDKVKHLLDIPEPPKTLDEISQELDEKIDALIKTTKEKFECSNYFAGKRYNEKFDMIIENFEYAKEHGEFRPKLTLSSGIGVNIGSYVSYVIKQGSNHKGYYTMGNQRYFRYYMPDKPNRLVRFFMKVCLGFVWVDETT